MSDFKIYVSYNPASTPPFSYLDENGKEASHKNDCKAKKTIRWILDPASSGSDLKIHFPNRNPFSPDTPDPIAGKEYKFKDNPDSTYEYDVSVQYGGRKVPDDPQIMFAEHDPDLAERVLLDDSTLDKIAKSADAAWGALFSHLKDAAKLEGDPERIFFPKGISLISVEVDAGDAVKVIIKVAGSDAPSGSLAEKE